MMADVEAASLQRLTQRDRTMIATLGAALQHSDPGWVSELREMEESGYKADIEAVYDGLGGFAGLSKMLAMAVLRRDYI